MKLRTCHLPGIVKLDRDFGVSLDSGDSVNCDLLHRNSSERIGASGHRVTRSLNSIPRGQTKSFNGPMNRLPDFFIQISLLNSSLALALRATPQVQSQLRRRGAGSRARTSPPSPPHAGALRASAIEERLPWGCAASHRLPGCKFFPRD